MKSWTCIEKCGACCKFDLKERSDLADKLNKEDIALINSMTDKDGWCKNLDRENKKCLIYEKRPHFCRVNSFSISFKGYLKFGDKFLIECCKQHISSNYGCKSKEMKTFKMAVSGK
tara:strand:+ start:240 stop:587 length:348 start_codon:yes stop_codon:yes gene_type:complete